MPLARFNRLDSDRRQRLLAAAAHEFAAEGYEGASLGWIAEEAGFSKAALYYYFEDKADLYATVVREAWRQLLPNGLPDVAALDHDTFWPALAAFHLAGWDRFRQEPWLLAVWKLAFHPPPDGTAAEAVAEVFGAGQSFLEALTRRGQELGIVRSDMPVGLLIAVLTGADNAADHWLADQYETLGFEEISRLSRRTLEAMRLFVSPPAEEA